MWEVWDCWLKRQLCNLSFSHIRTQDRVSQSLWSTHPPAPPFVVTIRSKENLSEPDSFPLQSQNADLSVSLLTHPWTLLPPVLWRVVNRHITKCPLCYRLFEDRGFSLFTAVSCANDKARRASPRDSGAEGLEKDWGTCVLNKVQGWFQPSPCGGPDRCRGTSTAVVAVFIIMTITILALHHQLRCGAHSYTADTLQQFFEGVSTTSPIVISENYRCGSRQVFFSAGVGTKVRLAPECCPEAPCWDTLGSHARHCSQHASPLNAGKAGSRADQKACLKRFPPWLFLKALTNGLL